MDINFIKLWFKTALRLTKKFFWFLGKYAFSVTLVIILLELVLGGVLFYQYQLSLKKGESDTSNESFQFKYSVYQNVLTRWELRDQKLQESLQKNYSNPF